MFFSISKQTKKNFPNQYQFGEFVINTDNGWRETEVGKIKIIYKGYVEDIELSKLVASFIDLIVPRYKGNFCAFVVDTEKNQIRIHNDLYRGFPIFFKQGCEITNLQTLDNVVYSDNVISIDKDLLVEYPLKNKFDVIGDITESTISLNQAVEKIDHLLSKKTENFLSHNRLPIKVFLSGGVDSLLVFSYIKKYTDNYELVKCSHIDYDRFYLSNVRELIKFWGYRQIHHWIDPCILSSGAPGDEFMLRSPYTVNLYAKHHDIDVIKLLEQPEWCNSLHKTYFLDTKFQNSFKCSPPPWTHLQMIETLCNNVVNDWQHWHLGNTLTWTPLKDLEIFKIFLNLKPDDAIGQILDSKISKILIENNCPGLTKLISDQKNSGNYMTNLLDFYGM